MNMKKIILATCISIALGLVSGAAVAALYVSHGYHAVVVQRPTHWNQRYVTNTHTCGSQYNQPYYQSYYEPYYQPAYGPVGYVVHRSTFYGYPNSYPNSYPNNTRTPRIILVR